MKPKQTKEKKEQNIDKEIQNKCYDLGFDRGIKKGYASALADVGKIIDKWVSDREIEEGEYGIDMDDIRDLKQELAKLSPKEKHG